MRLFSPYVAGPVVLTIAATASGDSLADNTAYVDFSSASWQDFAAGAACAGLYNRPNVTYDLPGPVYMLANSDDTAWLQLVRNISDPKPTLDLNTFITGCVSDSGAAAGRYISYNSSSQQELIPNIITLAGVLDAVPLDVSNRSKYAATLDQAGAADQEPIFDAVKEFADFEPIDATRYVYQNHVNDTRGVSKMNPGYESQTGPAILRPNITRDPEIGLTDFIVKEKLFNYYLVLGCLPLADEHKLQEEIGKNNPWRKPLEFYGYDNTFVMFGGDTFEAETGCFSGVGAGQIASSNTNNLGYFSDGLSFDDDVKPLPSNPDTPVSYDSTKTYIAILVGDGDNVAYLKSSRRQWLLDRVTKCGGKPCEFPLLWTMNPHVLHLAPDWGQWYAEQLLLTGVDRFALPPSGDLYSYPSMFPGDEQDSFVANTERDAIALATSVTTSWEVAGNWEHALSEFFPRFAEHEIVTAAVGVNVPYMVPVLAFGEKFFKVLEDNKHGSGNHSVVFRPNEWRGTSGSDRQNLNVTAFAAEINNYPKGTVSPIYLTSDGGANMDDIFDLVAALDDHVVVVANEIGQLAMEAQSQLR